MNSMFIQWKGTDVCLDFRCGCGASIHVDGYFAHFIHCLECDTYWELGTEVSTTKVEDVDSKYLFGYEGPLPEFEFDPDPWMSREFRKDKKC